MDEYEEKRLREKFEVLLPALNERQQRLFLAVEAKYLGRGGVSSVAKIAEVSRDTIYRGLREIEYPGSLEDADERVREEGGGRKGATESQPGLLESLNAIVEPETRGDPMSPLRWTCKSTRQISETLKAQGFTASHQLVGRLLNELGYSLQANVKVLEGSSYSYEDRDEQFRHINTMVLEFQSQGQPVVSVDTKKKELIGNYKNNGREFQRKGAPVATNTHDFPNRVLGKVAPYGVYDVTNNQGWVSVGTSYDTAEFAVATIERWWEKIGKLAYPGATKLLITADCGGSNGARNRLWKIELARLAQKIGIEISVCHLPPGTSKWNKIEHRLFSFISMNWRGRPLTSHQIVVDLIGATSTKKGLSVSAELNRETYQKGIEVSKEDFAALPIRYHDEEIHLNYTISPGFDR
jgi:transposase